MQINSLTTVNPIKPKNDFELALDKLDLQGCLLLMTVLSEKALYLQSKDILESKVIKNTNNTPTLTKGLL